MRRSSGKKRVQRTKMAKKPMRKKTTKKGKNPWIQHVGKVFAELKKQDPKISYKQAIIEARKTYKKHTAQPIPEVEEDWNVSSSKYSTVGKKKKGSAKSKKGKSRRRRLQGGMMAGYPSDDDDELNAEDFKNASLLTSTSSGPPDEKGLLPSFNSNKYVLDHVDNKALEGDFIRRDVQRHGDLLPQGQGMNKYDSDGEITGKDTELAGMLTSTSSGPDDAGFGQKLWMETKDIAQGAVPGALVPLGIAGMMTGPIGAGTALAAAGLGVAATLKNRTRRRRRREQKKLLRDKALAMDSASYNKEMKKRRR